jgi:hypothetical protein
LLVLTTSVAFWACINSIRYCITGNNMVVDIPYNWRPHSLMYLYTDTSHIFYWPLIGLNKHKELCFGLCRIWLFFLPLSLS